LDCSTHLLNRSGSGWGIFNPFKFNPNTNPTQPDLFDSPIDDVPLLLPFPQPKKNGATSPIFFPFVLILLFPRMLHKDIERGRA